jgi:DNA modification methylase
MSLIRADARQLPLVDGCVDCCVTSPPYFGLRDYGTARWDGGDPACDHLGPPMRTNNKPSNASATFHGGTSRAYEPWKGGKCGKCGAQRIDQQIGLEATPDAFVAALVGVFREVRRVLKDDGTVWLNLGDSYATQAGPQVAQTKWQVVGASDGQNSGKSRTPVAGLKSKDLIGIPWRVAFALQADGWYLRSDIIWHKPNPMPESVTDRPTKAHEYLFLLAKSERYHYDADAIAEQGKDWSTGGPGVGIKETHHYGAGNGGNAGLKGIAAKYRSADPPTTRNRRSVWTIPTMAYAGAHFATFPEKLIEPCILAGCPVGGLVLDPFIGSGTVGSVAERLGRRWVGTDLSYQDLAKKRTAQRGLAFSQEIA